MSDRPEQTIDALLAQHRPGLLRYLTMRLGNAAEAEEVLQEAMLQFVKASETSDIQNAHALLVRICSRQAIDRLRHNISRGNRERAWSEDYYRTQSDDDSMGSLSAPQERQLAAKNDIEAVMVVLDGLSETVRTAFILHRFDGLSHREVAARMGLSQSTVEKHIMKASQQLLLKFRRN